MSELTRTKESCKPTGLHLYDLLGVRQEATHEEIVTAFRAKAKDCHPDKFPNDQAKAEEWHEIWLAHQILSDPKSREVYDLTGAISKAPVNDVFSSALSLIANLVEKIMQEHSEIVSLDIIEAIRDQALPNLKEQVVKNLDQVNKQIPLYKLVASRIKFLKPNTNAENDHLSNMIKRSMHHLNKRKKDAEQQLVIYDKAHEILQDYNYNMPPPPSPHNTFFANTWEFSRG